MGNITDLRYGKGREKRVKLFLDGRPTLVLQVETALKKGLEVGQELSGKQLEELAQSDSLVRCLGVASRYLSYRPRSESELRTQLHRRGFNDDVIEATLTKLREQGLVDDTSFARFWKENRDSFSPRSRWLTRAELRKKGVATGIIEQVIGTSDDYESAYQAAMGRIRRLPLSDYLIFRKKLGEFLRRRGFDYEVINHTIKRIWQEKGNSSNSV